MIISIIANGLSIKASKRLNYVLDFINIHPFTPDNLTFKINSPKATYIIGYGEIEHVEKRIYRSQVFFEGNNVDSGDYIINELSLEDLRLPFLDTKKKLNTNYPSDILPFDIFENIFFHISRYEEVFADDVALDNYARMKAENQCLVREGREKFPVVDLLVKGLIIFCGAKPECPERMISVSHDIDALVKFNGIFTLFRTLAGSLIHTFSFKKWPKLFKGYSSNKDPYDVYAWMLHDSPHVDKCIYLLVGGSHQLDTWYELDQPLLYSIKKQSEDAGYDIGLHPSMNSYTEEQVYLEEKEKLEKWLGRSITKSRQHFLRFTWPETPKIIETSGIEEDASLGFTDRVGFRCGTATPYHLYNFEEERPYRFLERPLICMDISLLRESSNEANKMREILGEIQSSEATYLSYNFHNSRFFDAWLEGIPLRDIYEGLFNK